MRRVKRTEMRSAQRTYRASSDDRRLLRTTSKGDATDIAVTVKNQAGRIYHMIGIGSPIIHPSSFFIVFFIFISLSEDIIPEFLTTHDTATISRSNRTVTAGAVSIIDHRQEERVVSKQNGTE